MPKKKEDWRIWFDSKMSKDYSNFKYWYKKEYKREPSKSDFIKVSLDIFSQKKDEIKRKPKSRNGIQCF